MKNNLTIADLKDIIRSQTDENSVRKDLTPSEAVTIAMVIEPEVKNEASQHKTVQAVKKLERPGGKLPPVREKREISWLGWLA